MIMRHRASVFVVDHHCVLLFHRLKNGAEYYTVPGGGIETGETPEHAAVRELKEETGLDVVLGEKIAEFEADNNYQHFYMAKSWSGTPALGGEELEKQSPQNIYTLEWVPIEKLGDIDLRKQLKELLQGYNEKQKKPHHAGS
jgi:8-oxo-dGTP pyrophosphatase MutT (NUDIX family)